MFLGQLLSSKAMHHSHRARSTRPDHAARRTAIILLSVVVFFAATSVGFAAAATIPDFSSCAEVIAIPGNSDSITDAGCGVCDNGAQSFYPCDQELLCYCSGSPVPAAAVVPFTYCTRTVHVPGNPSSVTDTLCAPCANGTQRHYPCDQPDVLCECAEGVMSTTAAPGTPAPATPAPTPVPPTPVPPTPVPPTPVPPTPVPPTPVPPTPVPPTPVPPTPVPPTPVPPTPVPPTPTTPPSGPPGAVRVAVTCWPAECSTYFRVLGQLVVSGTLIRSIALVPMDLTTGTDLAANGAHDLPDGPVAAFVEVIAEPSGHVVAANNVTCAAGHSWPCAAHNVSLPLAAGLYGLRPTALFSAAGGGLVAVPVTGPMVVVRVADASLAAASAAFVDLRFTPVRDARLVRTACATVALYDAQGSEPAGTSGACLELRVNGSLAAAGGLGCRALSAAGPHAAACGFPVPTFASAEPAAPLAFAATVRFTTGLTLTTATLIRTPHDDAAAAGCAGDAGARLATPTNWLAFSDVAAGAERWLDVGLPRLAGPTELSTTTSCAIGRYASSLVAWWVDNCTVRCVVPPGISVYADGGHDGGSAAGTASVRVVVVARAGASNATATTTQAAARLRVVRGGAVRAMVSAALVRADGPAGSMLGDVADGNGSVHGVGGQSARVCLRVRVGLGGSSAAALGRQLMAREHASTSAGAASVGPWRRLVSRWPGSRPGEVLMCNATHAAMRHGLATGLGFTLQLAVEVAADPAASQLQDDGAGLRSPPPGALSFAAFNVTITAAAVAASARRCDLRPMPASTGGAPDASPVAAAARRITAVSGCAADAWPSAGRCAPGVTVTVHGTGLHGAAAVELTPAATASGTVACVVTSVTPGGESVLCRLPTTVAVGSSPASVHVLGASWSAGAAAFTVSFTVDDAALTAGWAVKSAVGQPPCPLNATTMLACSQRGACDLATLTCECERGYAGAACEACAPGFFGADCAEECPGGACFVCHGHGTCRDGRHGDGMCSCDDSTGEWNASAGCAVCVDGAFGVNCTRRCAVEAATGAVCGAHGTCDDGAAGSGACVCAAGFAVEAVTGVCSACAGLHYGAACRPCVGLRSAANSSGAVVTVACSGHGTCDAGADGDGACACSGPYAGPECAWLCPTTTMARIVGGAADSATAPCSGHGECTAARTCACAAGFAGLACDECAAGYFGPECAACASVASGSCSGHGACREGRQGDGGCECSLGYFGAACAGTCAGLVRSDVTAAGAVVAVCSGHGSCDAATGACACTSNATTGGHWAGAACDECAAGFASDGCVVPCPTGPLAAEQGGGQSLLAACSGRGRCWNGVCRGCRPRSPSVDMVCGAACELEGSAACLSTAGRTCAVGRFGPPLCAGVCPGSGGVSSLACSGHGACDEASGQCACVRGFGGDDCAAECATSAASPLPCSGRGECGAEGCACDSGYFGGECAGACPTNGDGKVCAGHGSCRDGTAGDGACECAAGYFGPGCERECPGGAVAPCSGRGVCDGVTGTCACAASRTAGYFAGTACARCATGFGGGDCRLRCSAAALGGTDAALTAAGTRLQCECAAGFGGDDCGRACPLGAPDVVVDAGTGLLAVAQGAGGDLSSEVCSGRGRCREGPLGDGTCACDAEYFGESCGVQCTAALCRNGALGLAHAACNASTGACECEEHWAGSRCDECAEGFWGALCLLRCTCSGHGGCDQTSGECRCHADVEQGFWAGQFCGECAAGFIGVACRSRATDMVAEAVGSVGSVALLAAAPDVVGGEAGGAVALAGVAGESGATAAVTAGQVAVFGASGEHRATLERTSAGGWPTVVAAPNAPAGYALCEGAVGLCSNVSATSQVLAVSGRRFGRQLLLLQPEGQSEKSNASAPPSPLVDRAGEWELFANGTLRDAASGAVSVACANFHRNASSGNATTAVSVDRAGAYLLVASSVVGGASASVCVTEPSSAAPFLATLELPPDMSDVTLLRCAGVTQQEVDDDNDTALFVACVYLRAADRAVVLQRVTVVGAPGGSLMMNGTAEAAALIVLTAAEASGGVVAAALVAAKGAGQSAATRVFIGLNPRSGAGASVVFKADPDALRPVAVARLGVHGASPERVAALLVNDSAGTLRVAVAAGRAVLVRRFNTFGVASVAPAVVDAAGGTGLTVLGDGFVAGSAAECVVAGPLGAAVVRAEVVSGREVRCATPSDADFASGGANGGAEQCVATTVDVRQRGRATATVGGVLQRAAAVHATAAVPARVAATAVPAGGVALLAPGGVPAAALTSGTAAACVVVAGPDGSVGGHDAQELTRLAVMPLVAAKSNGTVVVCDAVRAVPSLRVTPPGTTLRFSLDGAAVAPAGAAFVVTGAAAGLAASPESLELAAAAMVALPGLRVAVVDAYGNEVAPAGPDANAAALADVALPGRTVAVSVVPVLTVLEQSSREQFELQQSATSNASGSASSVVLRVSPLVTTATNATAPRAVGAPAAMSVVFAGLAFAAPASGLYEVRFVLGGLWQAAIPVRVVVGRAAALRLGVGTATWLFGNERALTLAPAPVVVVADGAGNAVTDAAALPDRVEAVWLTVPDADASAAAADPKGDGRVSSRLVAFRLGAAYVFEGVAGRGLHGTLGSVRFSIVAESASSSALGSTAAGIAALDVGGIATAACAAAELAVAGTARCAACPTAGVCDGTSNWRAPPGFWRGHRSAAAAYACPAGVAACPQGANQGTSGSFTSAASEACGEGYEGPLCSVCEAGYGKAGEGRCTECTPVPGVDWALAVLVLVLLAAACVFFLWRSIENAKTPIGKTKDALTVVFKMLLNHVQLIGIIGARSGDVAASPVVSATFAGIGAPGGILLAAEFGFTSCSAFPSFPRRFVVTSAVPLALMGLCVLGLATWLVWQRVGMWRRHKRREAVRRDPLAVLDASMGGEASFLGKAGGAGHSLLPGARDNVPGSPHSDGGHDASADEQRRFDEIALGSQSFAFRHDALRSYDAMASLMRSITPNAVDRRLARTSDAAPAPVMCYLDPVTGEMSYNPEPLLNPRPTPGRWLQLSLLAIVVVANVVLPTVLTTSGRMLVCEDVDMGGGAAGGGAPGVQSLLVADRRVDCRSDEYAQYETAAAVQLAAYAFGLPLLCVAAVPIVALAAMHRSLAHAKHGLYYLTGGYRPGLWFWEALVIMRKGAMALASFGVADARLRVYTGMWVVGLALAAQAWQAPYTESVLNRQEGISLGAALVTLWMVALYDAAPGQPGYQVTAVAVLVAANAAVIVTYAWLLGKGLRRKLAALAEANPARFGWYLRWMERRDDAARVGRTAKLSEDAAALRERLDGGGGAGRARLVAMERVAREAALVVAEQDRPLAGLEVSAARLEVCVAGVRARVAALAVQCKLAADGRGPVPTAAALKALLVAERGVVEAAVAIHATVQRRSRLASFRRTVASTAHGRAQRRGSPSPGPSPLGGFERHGTLTFGCHGLTGTSSGCVTPGTTLSGAFGSPIPWVGSSGAPTRDPSPTGLHGGPRWRMGSAAAVTFARSDDGGGSGSDSSELVLAMPPAQAAPCGR